MINLFISVMIALFSFQAFSFSYQITGIRKTVINIPMTIFENSIPIYHINDEDYIASFDKKKLENYLNLYFENELRHFTKNYEVNYYYYNAIDETFCSKDKCDGIKVKVSASLMFSFTYEEKMFYEIRRTGHEI